MMNLWLSNFDIEVSKPPESVWKWMKTKTSITEKAKQSCQSVRLALLNEQWTKDDEDNDIFVREINMFCDEKIAWYARSSIPKSTYDCRIEKFQSLHNQPLGQILYNDPDIIREDFLYAYLDPDSQEYQWAIAHFSSHLAHSANESVPLHLWARKSVFRIDKKPLYLMEVFFHVP